jgi:EcsC protein family
MTMPLSISAEGNEAVFRSGFAPEDWTALAAAVEALERVSLASSLNRALGKRIKAAASFVPQRMAGTVSQAVNLALRAALGAAIRSLGAATPSSSRAKVSGRSMIAHRAAVTLSGAAGGAFGLAMLPVELPVSTTLMLRAIADIARAEGEDLSDPDATLACIEVFALGGAPGEESWESGYFAVRAFLAKAMGSATLYLASRSVIEEAAPALMRYISLVAARFGAAVTQKLAAQAVPLLGAAGGAAVNYVFMEHFQRVAKGHFTVRRLERIYGFEVVREAYERIRLARAGDRARPVSATPSDASV